MIAMVLAVALVLALALCLVLGFVLPRRVAHLITMGAEPPNPLVAADRSRREAQAHAAQVAAQEATVAEVAVLAASLRAMLCDLDRGGQGRPPPQTLPPETQSPFSPFSTVETTPRNEGRKPWAPPASRDRPTPRALTPPGSARPLPAEPGIVAARLGPRPDSAGSRVRGEPLCSPPDPHRPPRRSVALSQTLPSMPSVGARATRPPPRVDVEESPPEDEAS
jgi:hypothetical protein